MAQTLDDTQAYYEDIAPFYDLELSDRSDVRFWLALVRCLRPRAVLDAGAGTGRITLPLARLLSHQGGVVWGLDLCESMLARAREKVAQSSIPRLARHVHFVRGDLREFALQGRFDLVIAANDPFAHLLDDADVAASLAAVRHHLRAGGWFVVELPVPRGQEAVDASGQPRTVVGRREIRRAGVSLEFAMEQAYQPGRQDSQVTCRYRLLDAQGQVQQAVQASFASRARHPEAWTALCQGAGLTVVTRWGGFDFCPFDAGRSSELIVAARKAANDHSTWRMV